MYGRDYGPEADWWNVGILIMEMLTAENPMRGELVLSFLYTWHTTLRLCARIHGWDCSPGCCCAWGVVARRGAVVVAGENRRESEYLTKHKDLIFPPFLFPEVPLLLCRCRRTRARAHCISSRI